jgi:phosphoenolpyruvate carboxylase
MKDDVEQFGRVGEAPALAPLIAGTSVRGAADLLFNLLLDVARTHQPEVEAVLKGGASVSKLSPELTARALQAQGIWFQLFSIAEQLRGTFGQVIAEAAQNGVPAAEIQMLVAGLRIRPVLTAHPTESKRVTVLEKYRRIYLLLLELENQRWTERERNDLVNLLRDQIELVWMTGELHLEKPSVEHEVSRGLHFFDERCSKLPRKCSASSRRR